MRILLTLAALASLLPLPAQAYLTPEQVLEQEDFVAPPPNARNAEAARAAQEAEYDARRTEQPGNTDTVDEGEEVADDADEDEGNNTIDDLHGSADDEEVIDWEPEDADLSADERRDERVLERVEQARLDDMAQNAAILRGSAPEQLHGGAPLAPTGSGTILAVLLGAAAVGYTLRKALKA